MDCSELWLLSVKERRRARAADSELACQVQACRAAAPVAALIGALGGELKYEPVSPGADAEPGSASVKQPRAVTMMKTAVLAATAIAKPSVEAMCRRPLAPPGRGALKTS